MIAEDEQHQEARTGPWFDPPGTGKTDLEAGTTKRKWLLILARLIWTAATAAAIVGAMIVGYALHLEAFDASLTVVGVYGLVVLGVTLLQFAFSTINRYWTIPRKRKRADEKGFRPTVGLQAVGYREDQKLWLACLKSLRDVTYSSKIGPVACIDGNDGAADAAMAEAFDRVFVGLPGAGRVTLDKTVSSMTADELREFLTFKVGPEPRPLCVFQPHAGKREAMYAAFRVLLHWNVEFVYSTDSDTVTEPGALDEMAKVAVDDDTGAVCGDVLIFNVENWVSFLSSLRYWYAFNVERSAQSLWGSVTCVSGPIGLYRARDLRPILNRWVRQTWLGSKATFGDDRHLTNLVISQGRKVHYTPWARCHTDTPVPLARFLAQQLRWSQSFFREILFNLGWIHRGSIWLAVELAVQFAYPFFLATTIVYALSYRSLDMLVLVPVIAILVGGVRAAWAVLNTRRTEFVYYGFYSVVYMLFLVPTKLFAILTLWSNDWGTSVRSAVVNRWSRAIHAVVWAVGIVLAYLGVGLWLAVARKSQLSWTVAGVALAEIGVAVILVLWAFVYGLLVYLPRKKREAEILLSGSFSV
jgi:hyaluronan synthase